MTDSQLGGLEVDVFVDLLAHFAGSFALVFADVLLAEEELTIEVADFDVVIVSDSEFALLRTEADEGELFDELAAQGACSDDEGAGIGSFGHELVSQDNVIVMIAILCDCACDWAFGKHFEELMVQPLPQRSVLSCQFYDLLSDDASPEGTGRRNLSLGEQGDILNQLLVD